MDGEFIGRERELPELMARLEDALRGSGRVVLLVGEPGIGKTALAEQLTGRAVELGARAVWGRAWDGGGAPPYWAWTQIIRGLAAISDEATLRRHLESGPGSLAVLVPELAADVGGAAGSPGSLDSDRGRFALFESVSRFLREVSSAQPLVLVLEDVLAGDRASLQLLQFLAREARDAHLLVVATCREIEATRSPEGVELLADLLRAGHVVEVRGLDLEEVRALITSVTGTVPWAEKAAAIHDATAGNPLFVREVTRLVAAEDPLDRPGRFRMAIPSSVRAVIRHRLSPLSADAVATLAAAAVVGRDFDLALVEAASALPQERVSAALEEAGALGVVTTSADAPERYRFSHPLIREVFYDGLPRPVRAQMHRQVGEAIERGHGREAAGDIADLALHFSGAAGSTGAGDAAKALQYARRAGAQALDAWAYEEAAAMYRRALEALEQLARDEATRCELLLRLGDAQARAGFYAAAKATLLGASAIARRLGDPEQLARAALGIGEQPVGGGLVDRELVGLLQEALEALGPDGLPLRSRVLARLSLELTFSDEDERRQALSQEALALARRLGDPLTLTHAWRARWMAVWGPDGLEERSALSEEMLDLALENGDPEMELVARARRITCFLEGGDLRSVDVEMAAHARLAGALRMPVHEWTAATLRAMRALLHGSVAEAEALADAALPLQAGRPNGTSAHLGQLTVARWEQGRLGELRDAWHALIEQFPHAGFGRAWLCLANAELGRAEEARIGLDAAVDEVLALPRNGLWLLAAASTALAAAHLEERDAAARLYPLLLPYAGRTIIVPMPHPIACYGSAALYLGLLATTMGRWEEAERHFEAARQANHRLGAGAFVARTCCEQANLLLRRGRSADRPRALALLRRAADTARPLGLEAIRGRVAALQARAEAGGLVGHTNGKPAALPAGVEPLALPAPPLPATDVFRREGDVWTIVHGGAVARLRDVKGLRCLAQLLASPGREVLAIDLEASAALEGRLAPTAAAASTSDPGLAMREDLGDAGEMLDGRARAAYRDRLDELREELEEAEAFNDLARAARAREERELLTNELARAVGLGGRDRRAASHAERARLNVTRAIRAAMRSIARVHPPLAEHLSLTIRTGRYCCYAPDPRAPIHWHTGPLHS